MSEHIPSIDDTPVQLDQEWANALTHAVATAGAVVLGTYMTIKAASVSVGLAGACAAYGASVIGTFLFSTLSHSIHRQPLLNKLRAWDQAMIYLMITGTYTPIAFRYATEGMRTPLLMTLWLAALAGFGTKVAFQHRVNSITSVWYLMLGWLPAIPLVNEVPRGLGLWMLAGGVLYTVGVCVLFSDKKFRYGHALWHVFVILAATCHWLGILLHVVLR